MLLSLWCHIHTEENFMVEHVDLWVNFENFDYLCQFNLERTPFLTERVQDFWTSWVGVYPIKLNL